MHDQGKHRFRRIEFGLSALDALAEKHISTACENGAFDNLPGAGKPLQLDDDALVPEELRAAYRILKNSGYAPAEVEALRDLREVEHALARQNDAAQRDILFVELNVLLARASAARGRNIALEQDYFQKIAEKLAQRRR